MQTILYYLHASNNKNLIHQQTNNNSNILYDVYVTKIRNIYSTMLDILITKQILKYIYNTNNIWTWKTVFFINELLSILKNLKLQFISHYDIQHA